MTAEVQYQPGEQSADARVLPLRLSSGQFSDSDDYDLARDGDRLGVARIPGPMLCGSAYDAPDNLTRRSYNPLVAT